MPTKDRDVRGKPQTTVSALHGVIENELRPQLERLRKLDPGLGRRVTSLEDSMTSVMGALVDLKNDMGESLSVVLSKLDKLADHVGAEK